MHRIRVYVDTSVFGGTQDDEFVLASTSFFDRVRRGEYVVLLSDETTPPQTGAAHDAPVKPYSARDDIPGLPPFDPDMIEVLPSGFDLIWDFVRSIFGLKPRDYVA